MQDIDLERLLSDLESDRVERKQSASDMKKICQAVCAFANDLPNYRQPGVLFIGVTDQGECANLEITDELLIKLADIRSNGNILPFPIMSVEKKTLNGCEMIVVQVEPSDSTPVRYKGRTWIRTGPRRATATAEEERRLSEKRRSGDLPFDRRSRRSASVSDFDLDLFHRTYLPAAVAPEVLEENNRSTEQQLLSLRFLNNEDEKPTVVGLLTIGKSPADYIPGAYVQFLRIAGLELSDPISDRKECHGPLPELVRQIDDIMIANNRIATDIQSGAVEIQKPDYPIVALQQLVRNAVIHRDYETSNAPILMYWFDDRIEIHNPGGPYGQVTIANFGEPGITDYRNLTVAEVMHHLGFVQRFGVGIATARNALEKNGNPPPEFNVQVNHIAVTVRK